MAERPIPFCADTVLGQLVRNNIATTVLGKNTPYQRNQVFLADVFECISHVVWSGIMVTFQNVVTRDLWY